MRNRTVIFLAVALATACDRQQPPAAAPPRSDAAPAQELPAADTAAPAAAPQAIPPPGTPSAVPSDSGATRGPATVDRTAAADTRPRPNAPPRGPQAKPPTPPAPAASHPAPSQQDEGAAILQRASAAYANMRTLKADFVMQYTNPLLRQQTTSRGTLYQRRPDRIALRFSEPPGDVILSDGQFYWVYYPSVDAEQVVRCAAAEGGEQGVDLQAQFVGDPVRRFQYTLHGQEPVGGRPAHVLTLEPRERTDYRTLKVWLDTRDSLARRFEITEHNNTVRRFELSDFEVNPSIPDATFRFTPPAGARIVSCG